MLRIVREMAARRRPSPPPKEVSEEIVIAYVLPVLSDLRHEIGRADQKASVLFAALGIGTGIVAGALLGGQLSPGLLPLHGRWLWWAASGFYAAGVTALALAIYPRSSRGAQRLTRRRKVFVGEFTEALIVNLRGEDLGEAARARVRVLTGEVRRLAAILDIKYRHTRRAIFLLLVSAACLLGVVFLAQPTG